MFSNVNKLNLLVTAVALTVSHGVRLGMNNNFALSEFNSEFFQSTGAILIAFVIMDMIKEKLEKSLKEYKNGSEPVFSDDRIMMILSVVETALLVTVPKIVKPLLKGRKIELNSDYLRLLFLSVSSVCIYNIILLPFVDKLASGKKKSVVSMAQDIVKKTSVLAVSDYMVDLEIEREFGASSLSTAAGVILSEIAKPKLSTFI